jgi:hypothetical protein
VAVFAAEWLSQFISEWQGRRLFRERRAALSVPAVEGSREDEDLAVRITALSRVIVDLEMITVPAVRGVSLIVLRFAFSF